MPIQKTMTTCLYHNATKQFMWDVEDYQLQCIQSVGLVVGGILPSTEYITVGCGGNRPCVAPEKEQKAVNKEQQLRSSRTWSNLVGPLLAKSLLQGNSHQVSASEN